MKFHPQAQPRHLVIVLGEQLDNDSAGFDGFNSEQDAVWMAEVAEESTHVWSHKARIAVFLSAMRHFRDTLRQRSVTVHYRQLDEAGNHGAFVGELTATIKRLSPPKLIVVEPGEWRVRESLQTTALALGVDLELRPDRHFLSTCEEFAAHAIGWREFVRGIYWHFMPGYRELNVLNVGEPLPVFYWTGKTEMNCLREAIGQTLEFGYAHHIQRLMVTGLFSLLLGVKPQAVHEWYLAMYVDAVEWVELPNTLGMSQHGDGGLMASKPYVASGKYIERMSNYCEGCRFDPAKSTGDDACPFTTLYWDFLLRHEKFLAKNQRMAMQLKNLARLDAPKRKAIQQQATQCRAACRQPTAAV